MCGSREEVDVFYHVHILHNVQNIVYTHFEMYDMLPDAYCCNQIPGDFSL